MSAPVPAVMLLVGKAGIVLHHPKEVRRRASISWTSVGAWPGGAIRGKRLLGITITLAAKLE